MFGATAFAQEPAVDQYSTTSVGGTVTGGVTVAPTTPSTPVTGSEEPTTPAEKPDKSQKDKDPADKSGGKPSDPSKPGNGPNSRTRTGTGGQALPALEDLTNRVAIVQFGTAPKQLQDDIIEAMRLAGLQVMFNGNATKKRLTTFLASPLATLMAKGGDEPVGRAFGAQLVDVTPLAQRAFPVLFGPRTPFVPVIRAVLTRRDSLKNDQIDFQTGVTKGLKSTDIPLAYVERSDRKTKTLVEDYRKLGVLTVDDIDTLAGKQRLGAIMLGAIKTQKAVDAVKVDPASQLTGDGGDAPGATPWLILAVLGGTVVFFAGGTFRRRGRSTA